MKKYTPSLRLLFAFTFFIATFSACRKDPTVFDGPNIEETLGSFRVTQNFAANKDSVRFSSDEKVIFSAKFNKTVNWTITVTGQSSQAKKVIAGQSKTIDATNAVWNGSTTNFPLFKAENCSAKLKIEGVQDSFLVNVEIRTIKQNTGLVLADFENGFNTKWTKFIQNGLNMDFAIKTDAVTPQGAKYLRMAGTVSWDYLIGLIDFNAQAYGTTKTMALDANPNNVYFNCLIYGEPGTNESLVLFQFKEDENADGTINASSDDQYDYQITVNWEGWKLITVKYADIISLTNGQPTTPKGNSVHNPDKIGKISMLHLANPANGFAACKIDYIIMTNSPLQP